MGAAPALSSRAISLHRVSPSLLSPNTLFQVAIARLFRSHSTVLQSATRLTLSLCCHDTNAALGPPQAPRQGQSGTLSLHCVGSSPLPLWRVFVVVCAHYTEHVAHCAVSTTSRGWPLSCANAGLIAQRFAWRRTRHPRTHRPFRPVRPCFRRCGPAASLLCTDTHSIPPLRWLTPIRSCATHSMPSRFTAHKGQSGGHARALAPHEVAWLAQWPQYRAPLAVDRGDFPPRAHYRTHIPKNRKGGQGLRSIGRAGGLLTEKGENFPFTLF